MISTLLTTLYGQKSRALQLPPSYGKTFKMFELHRGPKFTYQFETYNTSVMIIILLFRLKEYPTHNRLLIRSIIANRRLIARSTEPCLRWDALPTRLSAPVRCRRIIKLKAYCSQRCHPPAKAWW